MGLTDFLGNAVNAVVQYVADGVAGVADEDNGVCDLQLGTRVFNDVPVKMRTELWLSQLHRDKGRGAAAVRDYQDMLESDLPPELLADIHKDTHRTFPGHRKLSTRAGQDALARILKAYAASDPEIGYAQGMNFVGGLLMTYLDSEAEAFGALTLVMKGRNLREMFLPDMALLQVRLWQLGRLMPQDVAMHLEENSVLPVLYASSWFLTLFAGDFPMSFSARIMDLVIADGYAAPIMKVAVHIMERCREDLLKMTDMEEIVNHLRQTVPSWSKAALHDLLTEALGKPWTPRQAVILSQINGAESVIDAVARVDEAVRSRQSMSPTSVTTTTAGAPAHLSSLKEEDDGNEQEAVSRQQDTAVNTTINKGGTPVQSKKLLLPPPGRVLSARWRPDTPSMKLVSTNSARIGSIAGEVAIDPALSKQLYEYTHAHPPPSTPDLQSGGGLSATTPQGRTSTQKLPPSSSVTVSGLGTSVTSIPASPFDSTYETALETLESTSSTAAYGGVGAQGQAPPARILSSDFGSFQQASTSEADTDGMADLLGDLSVNDETTAVVNNNEHVFGQWQNATTTYGSSGAPQSLGESNRFSSTMNSTAMLLNSKPVPGKINSGKK